jgi:hypothetical protein
MIVLLASKLIEYVTINEWKRRYGQPGSGADRHGRVNDTFPTEPCFCEHKKGPGTSVPGPSAF